jgi:hypothetical protein
MNVGSGPKRLYAVLVFFSYHYFAKILRSL